VIAFMLGWIVFGVIAGWLFGPTGGMIAVFIMAAAVYMDGSSK
jgi:hypothetical protein